MADLLRNRGNVSPRNQFQMRRTEESETAGSSSGPSRSSLLRNAPDTILLVFKCFSCVTILIAILCVAVNVLAAIRSFQDSYDLFDGIFRCYAAVIACFVILAEAEWSFILKYSKVLEYSTGRGMLQIFVAVMTRAFPGNTAQKKDLLLLQNIACYLLLACGVVYFVSGLWIDSWKRARQLNELSREQVINDLQELDRRREELDQFLIRTEGGEGTI